VDTDEEGDSPPDAEKDTEDVALAVKDCVASVEKVSLGAAVALYVGCDVHDEEGFTVMVAECVAESDTRRTVGVAAVSGEPVAAADSVKDAVAHAESVGPALRVPVVHTDAVVVGVTVTVCVGIVEGDALTVGDVVVVYEPDTVFVSEPPLASLAEPVGAVDAEEEPEAERVPDVVPLPVGDSGGGLDTVALLLGVSRSEDV
jgi:hypothetical protein